MRIRAKHIQVDSTDTANEVIDKLSHGRSFEELAQQYSQCPTARQGGNLGEFGPGHMPELDPVFTEGEIGALYGPVESSHGFHIIQVTARRESA